MKISEIISQNAAYVSPQTTVLETAQIMKLLDVSMLPVCDHNVATGCDAKRTCVADVMTEETVYCFDDQDADEAAHLMREHEVRRLPVLNREKRLVGIISLDDLAACDGNEEMAGEVLGRIAVGSLSGRAHTSLVKMETTHVPCARMTTSAPPSKLAPGLASWKVPTTHPAELDLMLRRNEDIVIVDVRETEDYERGHVPGALNLPPNQWHNSERLCEDALNIVYGYSPRCQLATRASRTFGGQGYLVIEMAGGFESWKSNSFDISTV
jgi:rhodanese-related sulfurtransferase/predicted transcriptional regulator